MPPKRALVRLVRASIGAGVLALVIVRPFWALIAIVSLAGTLAVVRARRRWRWLGFLVASAVAAAVLLESLLLGIRHLPALAALKPLTGIARELYMLDRSIIQYEPVCARYDPRLSYTLRPGQWHFSNTEFDVIFKVNHLGLRDDEASLVRPEIVVVGDSFAMGWGVGQDETFAQVLERLSGRSVLNASVSSWGTARELRALEAIDLGATTHLIIQFCSNDYRENERFHNEGPDFKVQSEADYERAAAYYRKSMRYFPGRYAHTLFGRRLRPLIYWSPLHSWRRRGTPSAPLTPKFDPHNLDLQRQQVRFFLEVLARSKVDLSGLNVVVFELNSYNRDIEYFMPLLNEALSDPDPTLGLPQITAVNLAEELTLQGFFVLDDHLTPAGHRYIAERLLQMITRDSP